jgi:hypothetical protein
MHPFAMALSVISGCFAVSSFRQRIFCRHNRQSSFFTAPGDELLRGIFVMFI